MRQNFNLTSSVSGTIDLAHMTAEEKARLATQMILAQQEKTQSLLKQMDRLVDKMSVEAVAARDEWLVQHGAPSPRLDIVDTVIAPLCAAWWKVAFKPYDQKPWNDPAFRATEPVQLRTIRYKALGNVLQKREANRLGAN